MITQEILSAAMRQSAIDCSCGEEDFRRETNVIVESRPSEKASRYLTLPHACALFSYGSNIVVSCRKDLIPEITAFVNEAEKIHRCFEPPALYRLNRILRRRAAVLFQKLRRRITSFCRAGESEVNFAENPQTRMIRFACRSGCF